VKLQDHYDWIVFGSQPGALLSACLVARMGFSVLLLPMSLNQGLTVSRTGQLFDPETNYLIGLGRSGEVDGLIRSCLVRVGIQPAEEAWIRTENCSPHILTSRNRLVFASNELLPGEFHREFGSNSVQALGLNLALHHMELPYLKFWKDLPDRLTLSDLRKPIVAHAMTLKSLRKNALQKLGGTLGEAARGWVQSGQSISEFEENIGIPGLSQVFEGLWYSVTTGVRAEPSLPDLLHVLALSRVGGSFKGGLTAYRLILINLAKRLGVQVFPEVECRRFFVDRGKFSGVQLTQGGNMISAGGGILGFSFDRISSRLTYTGRNWLRRTKKAARPLGWKMTLALTINEEAIPIGMSSRAVLKEKDAPVLELEVVEAADYANLVARGKVLFLRTLMPFSLESLDVNYQQLIAARMLRRATELFPFLDQHIRRIYPEFRSGMEDLGELYGFAALDLIPDQLIVYSGEGKGSASGIDGLFVASEESYPELGNLGPTVAGLESAAWLAHRSGLAGPFT